MRLVRSVRPGFRILVIRALLTFPIVVPATISAQEAEISDQARAFCDEHASLPENKPYESTIAQQCYAFATANPGVVEQMQPDQVHGTFRFGSLICDTGYWKGYDETGYIEEGPCVPHPEVENGKFGGSCDEGYILVVDRPQTRDNPLMPDEMQCVKIPPERASSLNKCPPGTIAIAAMSKADKRRFPYHAQCTR